MSALSSWCNKWSTNTASFLPSVLTALPGRWWAHKLQLKLFGALKLEFQIFPVSFIFFFFKASQTQAYGDIVVPISASWCVCYKLRLSSVAFVAFAQVALVFCVVSCCSTAFRMLSFLQFISIAILIGFKNQWRNIMQNQKTLFKKKNNTAKPSLFFTIYSCNKLLVVFTRPTAFFTLSSHHCMPPWYFFSDAFQLHLWAQWRNRFLWS